MIIGSNIIFRENLPSTNTFLDELLKSRDLQEGTIVYTNYQSEGKGQRGNKWESEDGKNLLVSVLLLPSFIEPADQFILPTTISLGICDFLKRYIPVCKIKWPNDIYVNDDKIAGILIENTILEDKIEYSIAGIGINLNQEKFLSDAPNPVSLALLTHEKYDIRNCLMQLAENLDYRYKQLQADKDRIKDDYLLNLYRFNEATRFRDDSGEFTGNIISVSESGKLKVRKQTGEYCEYSYKEVEFIP
jgi:BirA family transcriptional regulator, biotin operon repressor / biotin---[acetyl-CoA-carboxylase] ligase